MVDKDLINLAKSVSEKQPVLEYGGESEFFCCLNGPKGAKIKLRRPFDKPNSNCCFVSVGFPPDRNDQPFDKMIAPIIKVDLNDPGNCYQSVCKYINSYIPLYLEQLKLQNVA